MATGPGFPSSTNVFIPGFGELTGRLIVGFARNPKKFALPRYVQYVPIKQAMGYYLKMTCQEAARVINMQDFAWPDGHPRPMKGNVESFNFVPFTSQRYNYGFQLGKRTQEQADWPVFEQNAAIKAALCMTARTKRMWTALTTAGNWTAAGDPNGDLSADHTDTATNVGGGKWNAGTSTSPYIKKTMDAVAVLITLDTLSVIGDEPESFKWVINPNTAKGMAESQEMHDYLKGSPDALAEITSGQGRNAKYGLPNTVYGYEIIVEKTSVVTSLQGATLARSFVVPDGAAVCLSRVGGIEGVYGAPSFSTATIFTYEDMVTERFDVPKDRLMEGHVAEDTAEAVTCPASGYYITAAV